MSRGLGDVYKRQAEALQKVKDCCNNFEDVKVVQEDSASLPSSADGKICGEKLNITGLCCANCARELEEDLNKIDGVSATVDFVNMRIILNSVSSEARERLSIQLPILKT